MKPSAHAPSSGRPRMENSSSEPWALSTKGMPAAAPTGAFAQEQGAQGVAQRCAPRLVSDQVRDPPLREPGGHPPQVGRLAAAVEPFESDEEGTGGGGHAREN